MRTTVTLQDNLYFEVRRLAATSGCTVNLVLEDAIDLLLLWQPEALDAIAARIRELPTFSAGGLQPGVDLDGNVAHGVA